MRASIVNASSNSATFQKRASGFVPGRIQARAPSVQKASVWDGPALAMDGSTPERAVKPMSLIIAAQEQVIVVAD